MNVKHSLSIVVKTRSQQFENLQQSYNHSTKHEKKISITAHWA